MLSTTIFIILFSFLAQIFILCSNSDGDDNTVVTLWSSKSINFIVSLNVVDLLSVILVVMDSQTTSATNLMCLECKLGKRALDVFGVLVTQNNLLLSYI